jgi:hypothetical protein
MPLQATSGAASQDAFGGNGVAVVPNYIEDVFSTYLYTATGPSAGQTITNNIDLSTKGGMVWIKNRTDAGTYPIIVDTVRGANKWIYTSATDAQATSTSSVTSFNTNGFTLGTDNGSGDNNSVNYAYSSPTNQVSWTFRKQPKFFDVVTYTGSGSGATKTISHNLGSAPACIFVKKTNTSQNWLVFHKNTSQPHNKYLILNSSVAEQNYDNIWGENGYLPTTTEFKVSGYANDSSATYVAYLFAHDAGGFGLTGTDNVISCGSYTGVTYPNSLEVTLGYEPQFVIIKNSNTASGWTMWDIMRGMAVVPAANTAQALLLEPNTSAADSNQPGIFPTATGFVVKNGLTSISSPSDKMIYIAIRRGPMKVPTTGTSVFGLSARSGTGANATVTGGQTDDAVLVKNRGAAVASLFSSRLTSTGYLVTSTDAAEVAAGTTILQANPWDVMDGVKVGTTSTITNASANTFINYLFKRAPSFFDEVCYTGTGSARTVSHNLAAVPELMIVKKRSATGEWFIYSSTTTATKYLQFSSAAADTSSAIWNDTTPTSSVFSLGTNATVNGSGDTFVAYLFATCAGVSKVGSYTGTGATQTINCGFTGGARFVLIKRSDAAFSNWYVFDTARGMVSGTDPRLFLNTTGAEVNENSVYTTTTGFQVVSTADALNASGGTFIFLAIA